MTKLKHRMAQAIKRTYQVTYDWEPEGKREKAGPPKPKPKARKVLDFSDCTAFIEKKYKINTRDYADCDNDFSRWCKLKGEKPTPCPPGCSAELMKAHQAQFARYMGDVSTGKFKEGPYQDFWHWLCDNADVQRGGTLEMINEMADGAEPWQKEIIALYLKEFGKGPYLTEW